MQVDFSIDDVLFAVERPGDELPVRVNDGAVTDIDPLILLGWIEFFMLEEVGNVIKRDRTAAPDHKHPTFLCDVA